MENITDRLKWIKDVADKLQVPQTYNERQRLLKIMEKAMPQIIKALESSAHMHYGTYEPKQSGDIAWTESGYTCNGCGYDHHYKVSGQPEVVDCVGASDREGNSRDCEVDVMLRFLKELEESSEK